MANGNLVLDPVPSKLTLPPWKTDKETRHTMYTAVTCDPDDFGNRGLFLRQNESNRSIELFVCVTVYSVRPSFALNLHDLIQL